MRFLISVPIEFWNTAHLFQDIRSQLNLDFFLLGDFNSDLSMPPRWRWWRLEYWVWHRLTKKSLCYLEISFNSGKSTCSPTWFLCSTGLLRLHRKTYMQGVPKNRLLLEPKIVTKLQCGGAKFPLDMTWEQLILLCLTEVRNDNFFSEVGQSNCSWEGCQLLVIERVRSGSTSILLFDFFRTPRTI